ncbi:MAG: hypothetical protein KDA24_10990 [Deltaproteobacteria bacterium]|nr:hypothetical protein [Deltaproteobacteria bacterium]
MRELKNVTVKKDGRVLVSGATGAADDDRAEVYADNPGLDAGDLVEIYADDGFEKPGYFIDERPAGTLNFKIQ